MTRLMIWDQRPSRAALGLHGSRAMTVFTVFAVNNVYEPGHAVLLGAVAWLFMCVDRPNPLIPADAKRGA